MKICLKKTCLFFVFLLLAAGAVCARGQAIKRIKADKSRMVLIPGATFEMGTNAALIPILQEAFKIRRAEMFADETPLHRVKIDSFYLDKYEVTNRDFKKFLDKNPAWRKDKIPAEFHNGKYLQHWNGEKFPDGKENYPIVFVSWYAAVAFCRSQGKRLPTEAEWEYAARGGRLDEVFPWGNEAANKTRANFGESGFGAAIRVGNYPPNGYRLFDMAGNVWEFLADEWQKYPAGGETQVNPVAGGDFFLNADSFRQIKTRRVIRGGSFGGVPLNLRVTFRDSHLPGNASDHVGFRCAQNAGKTRVEKQF